MAYEWQIYFIMGLLSGIMITLTITGLILNGGDMMINIHSNTSFTQKPLTLNQPPWFGVHTH